MQKKLYFTIVELLAVITILAIIASLIQPALIKTISKSEKVQCISNLKQVGNMSSIYIEDHDGRFAPDMKNWGPAYWMPALMNNYGDSTLVHRRFNPIGTIFECPSADKSEDAVTYLQGGLGYNSRTGSIADRERWALRNGGEDTTKNISTVTIPSETALFGDDIDAGYSPSGHFQTRLMNHRYSSRFEGRGINGALGARGRHQLFANYYWVDGHYEEKTWDQFITEGQAKGSKDWYLIFDK